MINNFDYNLFATLLPSTESQGAGGYSAIYQAPDPALGKYQLLYSTVKLVAKNLLNTVIPTIQDFLNNPTLQDQYFDALTKDNLAYINNNGLDKYIGRTINSMDLTGKHPEYNITTPINEYGLAAGAHLGGVSNLKKFLTIGYDPADSLGTKISNYVAYYSKLAAEKKKAIHNFGGATIHNPELSNIIARIEHTINSLAEIKTELNKL